jgi:hypothetical protein
MSAIPFFTETKLISQPAVIKYIAADFIFRVKYADLGYHAEKIMP